ncbi:MAG TPA: phosphonate C-P lyase system protein PhnG [Hydrogenophaga sp.]
MFHAFDNAGPDRPTPRPEWMALLARAPTPLLEAALAKHPAGPRQWLRRPETGLYMVQGRAGGTGERFNLGEMTVTRCALRAAAHEGAPVGVAYVRGRSHRQAELAALADALLQDPQSHAALDRDLLTPLRQHLAQAQADRLVRAQSTKVDFFTVAREAGSDQDDEEGAE